MKRVTEMWNSRREKEERERKRIEQGKQRTRYKGRRSRWVCVLSIDQTHWQNAGSGSWVLGPGLNPPRMQLTKPGLGDAVQWPGCSQEAMENSRWSRLSPQTKVFAAFGRPSPTGRGPLTVLCQERCTEQPFFPCLLRLELVCDVRATWMFRRNFQNGRWDLTRVLFFGSFSLQAIIKRLSRTSREDYISKPEASSEGEVFLLELLEFLSSADDVLRYTFAVVIPKQYLRPTSGAEGGH